MNQINSVVVLAILVALGMVGSSLTTILPSVYAQTSSGQAGSSSPPISGASPSQQATENACPTGTTSFSQGQCTVTTTTANQCPTGTKATGTGQGTCGVDACPSDTFAGFIKAIDSTTALCAGNIPGTAFPVRCPSGYTILGDQCVTGIACPSGTLQGQLCVGTTTTRPGQANQP
jgi:hypothetical protein